MATKTTDRSKELNKINDAFSKMQKHENRFLECERIYKAEYKDFNRTYKLRPEELKRSRLFVPLIKTTISIIHSIFKTSFLSTDCPIEISRIGQNGDHDQLLANALTAAVKSKWRAGSHYDGISHAVLSALYLPLGIAQVFWDGDIKTKFIPINDVAFDPYATSLSDLEYLCYRFKQSKNATKQKIKSGFYTLEKGVTAAQITSSVATNRVEIRELYTREFKNGKSYWQLTTFANDKFVREAKFERLPFVFGYCFESMPPISMSERDSDYIAIYGNTITEQLKELQEEYNIKRNQKIDITEQIIDPQFAINDAGGAVNLTDIITRAKFVRVNSNQGASVSDMIVPLTGASTYELKDEIAMLQNEYEIASGVNSIMTGQTSASDRRGMAALQTVNAASGTRIEAMLQTLTKTLLTHFAKLFVFCIYRNMPTSEFIALTENPEIESIIGSEMHRRASNFDFDININFGTTIQTDAQINKLNTLLGVLAQNNINQPAIISPILKQILILMLGENAPINEIDNAMNELAELQAAQNEASLNQMSAKSVATEASALQTMQAAATELAAPIIDIPPSVKTGEIKNLGDLIFAD